MRYRGVFLATLFILVILLSLSLIKSETFETECSSDYAPVCGNDGFTYDNECIATEFAKVKILCEGNCPCPEESVPCSDYYSPVCGKDGRTYGNSCIARKFGITLACAGKCPCKGQQLFDEISCERFYKPVCGENNITYANECYAKSFANVKIACSGGCPCGGPSQEEPEKTSAEEKNESVQEEQEEQEAPITGKVTEEEPEEEPQTPVIDSSTNCAEFEFSPVCDVTEKTHPNSCFAIQAGVEIKCEGVCPCKGSSATLFQKLIESFKEIFS